MGSKVIYVLAFLAVALIFGAAIWGAVEVNYIMNCTEEEFDAYLGL